MLRLTGDRKIFMNFKVKLVKSRQKHTGSIFRDFSRRSLVFFDFDGGSGETQIDFSRGSGAVINFTSLRGSEPDVSHVVRSCPCMPVKGKEFL